MMRAQMVNVVDVASFWNSKRASRGVYAGAALLVVALTVDWSGVSNLDRAKLRTVRFDENTLLNGVDRFVGKNGRLPTSLNELVPRFVDGVHADPWGGTYQLEIRGDQYAVVSLGKSQRAGVTEIVASRPLPQPNSQDQKTERHSP